MYFVKYHHEETLLREGDIKYVNGSTVEFIIDLDKIFLVCFVRKSKGVSV